MASLTLMHLSTPINGSAYNFKSMWTSSHFPSLPQKRHSQLRCQSTSTEEPKIKRNLIDRASNLLTNFLSGGRLGSMPTAEGAVSDLFGRPLFFSLYDWFIEHGSVYKLAFGPKSFVVVSDPIVARHILRENAFSYDKGVLADILEPIMGKGLIPADIDTWKQRRKVIAPGFHSFFLEAMVKIFTNCSERTVSKFENLIERENHEGKAIELDLEAEFSNLALDIIGMAVFNYDFGSVTKESPVIKAVYGTLFEAEHRSTFYIPYWNLPFARWIVPRQRKFRNDLKVINDCLDVLIRNAKETRQETDVEKLQQRDYSTLKDASLLRFLVDMRGADVDDRQLRDDLMTMLIAGHETTAAVLTWSIFLLAQNPSKMRKAQAEVDSVLGENRITLESIRKLEYGTYDSSLLNLSVFILNLHCSYDGLSKLINYQEDTTEVKMDMQSLLEPTSSSLSTTSTGLRTFGTVLTSLSQRGSWFRRRAKASADGRGLIQPEVREQCIQMR